MSGDVTASGIDHQNELRVSTLSGNVIIRSARARSVDADSTSGDVSLTDVICDRALVKAFSGDITYSGSLAKAGRYEFKSQSGDIRLTLAGAPGFELDASTFSGSVRSDFPADGAPGPAGRRPGRAQEPPRRRRRRRRDARHQGVQRGHSDTKK